MGHKFLASRLAAGAVLAAIVSAPIIAAPAAAADARDCSSAGMALTVCHTDGSSSLRAVPSVRAPLATPYFPLDRGIGAARALGAARGIGAAR